MKPAQPLPEKLEATNEQIRAEDFVFRLDATQCGSAAWDFPALAAEIAKRYNAHGALVEALESVADLGDDFCECDNAHEAAGTVCRPCFAVAHALALLAKVRA